MSVKRINPYGEGRNSDSSVLSENLSEETDCVDSGQWGVGVGVGVGVDSL
jgi:hypothetical protein